MSRSGAPDSAENLRPDAILRWEVQATDSLLSRSLLARLFPQAIRSDEMVEELALEEKTMRPLLSALFHLAFRALRIVLLTAVGVFGLFALFWYLASLAGHIHACSVVAYGMATWLTFVAMIEAATIPLLKSPLFRDRKAVRIRVCGFFSLPFLMYATACPVTTEFVVTNTAIPPHGLWDWMMFYGYMLLDVMLLGFPQGVKGELASFHPPSDWAGFVTVWAKTIMLIGVVAVIFGTIRRSLTRSYTFVGTVAAFREWSEYQFGRRWSEQDAKTLRYWVGRLLGKIRNRSFEVSVRARENPFPKSRSRVPLGEFQEFRYPEWKIDRNGQLKCKNLEERRAKARARKEGVPGESRETQNRRPDRRSRIALAILVLLPTLLIGVLIGIFLVISLPAFLLFFKVFHWELSTSIVVALLGGLTVMWMDRMVRERLKSLQFVALSRMKAHAISGTGSVPSEEVIRALNVDDKGLTQWVGIVLVAPLVFVTALFLKIRSVLLSWRKRAAEKPKSRIRKSQRKKKLPRNSNFYELIAEEGGLRMIVHEKVKTAWLLHHRRFRSQGRLEFLYSSGAKLIVLPRTGRGEWLDTLPKEQREKLGSCDRIFTLLVEDGKPPSKPEHVQELKYVSELSKLVNDWGSNGRTEREIWDEQIQNAYRYSDSDGK
ncbi:MAG: hypothetical protein KDN19_13625 [Verrucomicrobiae bacterium]|nr:hypothetical protein [Verrucomicrobiae bacterium]